MNLSSLNSVKMALFNVFNWTLETSSQAPMPKTEETVFRLLTTMAIALLVLGGILALIIFIYFFTTNARKSGGKFADLASPESSVVGSVKRRQFKRRKTKRASKTRLTKAQRLQEVNRKWYEIYGSDNSDCDDQEDLATVPFGTVEITEAKKVSFRESIKDVYFIETKEEMRRLEQLERMGCDVTIGRHKPFAGEFPREQLARELAPNLASCEDKGIVSAPLLYPPFGSSVYEPEEAGVSPKMLKKWLNAGDFEREGYETFSDEGLLNHHILDAEERLVNIPLLTGSSV